MVFTPNKTLVLVSVLVLVLVLRVEFLFKTDSGYPRDTEVWF